MTTQQARQALIDKDETRSYIVVQNSQRTIHSHCEPSDSDYYDIHAFYPGPNNNNIEFHETGSDLETVLTKVLNLLTPSCNP